MKAQLLRTADRLRESYWFIPTLMAVGALLLAVAMVWLDSHHAAWWMDRVSWLYAARPEGARSLLSSIGGSMIGVAGTTFSVTIAAVVYASGQYGPRLLSNFMSDRGNQVTLGTFIATFLYSLAVVRTVRSPGESAGEAAFVPQLALLVGVVLVLCSIAVLIYFIHHVPSRIHINDVIERIGTRLIADIDARFPAFIGEPLEDRGEAVPAPAAGAAVLARGPGYIQMIDEDRLLAIAAERGVVLRLHYRPGDFVRRGSLLAEASPPSAMGEDGAADVAAAFALGSRRTALQDLRFLMDELVEIAARALSPGVNDPFTAGTCLDWLGAAMAELAGRHLPSPLRADADGALRIVARPQTFAEAIARSFGALAPYAATDEIAGRRLVAALADVALASEAPSRRTALTGEAERFRSLAAAALPRASREVVLGEVDALLRRFGHAR